MAPSRAEPGSSPAARLIDEVRSISADILACGLVDLDHGDFLGLETEGSHPEDFLSYLAMTTKIYFEGDATRTIQTVLDEAQPERINSRDLQEITLRSANNLHVMQRLPREPRVVLVVVTSVDERMGLLLSSLRKITADVRGLRQPQAGEGEPHAARGAADGDPDSRPLLTDLI